MRKNTAQLSFLRDARLPRQPPSTRYQGSKLKLLNWIWENIGSLDFHTALDLFGGTASVSYLFKMHGKAVAYNDYLRFNHLIGTALIENRNTALSPEDVAFLLRADPNRRYDDFIARTFSDIYFTDDENAWLDVVCQNIPLLSGKYKQALAYHSLFQSCIVKRPYNLFHRKNLYIRLASVDRSFGNKATWDTAFERHFRNFAAEANGAVFDSRVPCKAVCHDAMEVAGRFDLVYLDPPYVQRRGATVDYRDFYHFLEGVPDYRNWQKRIDFSRKHLSLKPLRSAWSDPKRIAKAFRDCIERYSGSILVVSYGNRGIPSAEELMRMLRRVKSHVSVVEQPNYKYVLSIDKTSKELLFIAS
ncbi:MAG: DNA adenine methylase [Candidatus Binataceae bacterium]